jgi:hypothetical protein
VDLALIHRDFPPFTLSSGVGTSGSASILREGIRNPVGEMPAMPRRPTVPTRRGRIRLRLTDVSVTCSPLSGGSNEEDIETPGARDADRRNDPLDLRIPL